MTTPLPLHRNGIQSELGFLRKLITGQGIGEAHDDEKTYLEIAEKWAIDQQTLDAYPYLARVKRLSEAGWIHLRLLTDFMSIGTIPQRWDDLNTHQAMFPVDMADRQKARQARIEKTNVTVLNYHTTEVKRENYTSAQALKENFSSSTEDSSLRFKLYVVEDLSRDVIEILGQKFEIEPDFFRAHIVDFAWHTVRNRCRNPPMLDIIRRHQDWTELRYITLRYFDYQKNFKAAILEADGFNILRRVNDDLSNTLFWDKEGAVVGLTRSRATFWLQPTHLQRGTPVGIFLLDPTVTQGVPLWRGRRPLWLASTTCDQPTTPRPPIQDNFFEDFVFWAQQDDLCPNHGANVSPALVPIQVLLHLVCSEWTTMLDYIRTRLAQIDWEFSKPQSRRPDEERYAHTLGKLHIWKRLVPLCRGMVSETIQHIDQFSSRIGTIVATLESASAEGSSQVTANSPTTTTSLPSQGNWTLISHYESDFKRIKEQLDEYQVRIDQLTAVANSIISNNNSQRSLQDNRNIGHLTRLATFFIPLSVIAGILSMQPNVNDISDSTFKLYFAISLPLAVVITAATIVFRR